MRLKIDPSAKTGDIIKKGDKIAELIRMAKNLKLLSPISGKILSYNTMLLNNPSLNTEPYDKGWLANIEPQSWIKESS